ncbi:MAG: glycoside hydrolase family 13 protein [Winogradskyella sp.]|nr:glycoside hydrolase family 13 protein [Winogradskyella sp.]
MKNIIKSLFIVISISMFSCKENSSTQDQTNSISEPVVEIFQMERIEPPNWWVGFKNETLQLLIQHPNIAKAKDVVIDYPGVSVENIHKADSPNYIFVDLTIDASTRPGKFNINFKNMNGGQFDFQHTYELKARDKDAEEYIGFNSSDAIYLITPDRFANANPNNDSVEGLLQQGVDRQDDYARHGGDLEGITTHLDYIKDMGFTSIWPGPVLINDMKTGSYHGYAMTDFYKVDPRFGTLEDYRTLSSEMRNRNMKLIMDQVANHCGLEHWWMKDLPFKDWVNYQDHYLENKDEWDWQKVIHSNHRRTANQDLYASKIDKEGLSDGWFVATMPDLNQRNPFMAKYIIQNSIWWIETLQLGGIRQDTYPYPDKAFMSAWAGAIMTEYPNFSIVGEEWSYNPLLIAYWQDEKQNKDGYDSNLTSSMDFAMQQNIIDAFNEPESWDKGLVKIYEGLANDFAYVSPKDIMVFPDNHDMSRVFTQLKGDVLNTKMALSYLLMLPRIPQIYYGTEILMNDFEKPGDHGLIRTDFPGGWAGDTVNAFTGEGLSTDQKDMQSYLSALLNYRKGSEAIHNGSTVHFAPKDGVYVISRIADDETVVLILNKNDKPIQLDLDRFSELGLDAKQMRNVISKETVSWSTSLTVTEGSTMLTTKL